MAGTTSLSLSLLMLLASLSVSRAANVTVADGYLAIENTYQQDVRPMHRTVVVCSTMQ